MSINEHYYCSANPSHRGFNACGIEYNVSEIDERGNWVETIDVSEWCIDEDTVRCNECDALAKWGIPPSTLEQLAGAANGPETST